MASPTACWVRTLVWCRSCAGWVSEKSLGKRLRDNRKPGDSRLSYQLKRLEQGRRLGTRVPITKSEFQSLCDLHDEGTFMAQCGRVHKMEKNLVDVQNGGPDLFDEINEAKMFHNEDRRVFAPREREFGKQKNEKPTENKKC